jgi:type VI secretion system protein VasD
MAILGLTKEFSTVTKPGVVATRRKPVQSIPLHRREVLCIAFSSGVMGVLHGCAAAPKPAPVVTTLLNGSLQAAAGVNPSVSKRPSPLLVRVYELKGATAFNNADFVALFQRDQAELGADMVSREEIMLNPGETRPITKTLAPETRFIGVFAAYRDLERAHWRAIVAIEVGKKNNLLVRADELAISAALSN